MGSGPGDRISEIFSDLGIHSGVSHIGVVIPFDFVPHEVFRNHMRHVREWKVRPKTDKKEKIDYMHSTEMRFIPTADLKVIMLTRNCLAASKPGSLNHTRKPVTKIAPSHIRFM